MRPVIDPVAMKTMMETIPSPGSSAIRQALQFGANQYDFLRRSNDALGDVFTMEIPNALPRVILGHPHDIKKVFALRPERYYSADLSLHQNVGERCLIFTDGEHHRQDRSLLSPPLHGMFLEGYGPHMLECAQSMIDGWKPGSTVLLQDELTEATLRIIMRCVLGADEGEEREERLRRLVTDWLDNVLTPGLFMVGSLVGLHKMRRYLERKTDERLSKRHGICPYPGRKSTALKAEFMRMLIEDVELCRSEGIGERDDVLARVSAASYEGEGLMDMRTVVDQLTLLFSAGHETTAKSLGWVLRDITERPTLAVQLKAEVEEHFGDGPIDPLMCRELPLLNSVIKESMRLTPVTAAVQREITAPLEIRDYTLATGTVVAPSNYLAHRHPAFWKRRDAFIPDRFIGLKPPPNVYFPFGGGGRKCLGATFAEFEMPILLAPIVRRVELGASPGVEVTPVYGGITIGPSDGLPMKVRAVRGRAS